MEDNKHKVTEGYTINGDDRHWLVHCPECGTIIEYEGYFDNGEFTECECGCVFQTQIVWIDDNNYITYTNNYKWNNQK
jgi:phage terminase large subunit GpA-like protein